MEFYDFFSVVILPFTILHFSLDFLTDKDIKNNILKIGFYQFLHHLILVTHVSGFTLLPFMNGNLICITVAVLVSVIAQAGWLVNHDYCWLLTFINKQMNVGNRKWRGEIHSLIKHYTRGDQWAYSDIKSMDNTFNVKLMNGVHLFMLYKFYKTFKHL